MRALRRLVCRVRGHLLRWDAPESRVIVCDRCDYSDLVVRR